MKLNFSEGQNERHGEFEVSSPIRARNFEGEADLQSWRILDRSVQKNRWIRYSGLVMGGCPRGTSNEEESRGYRR